MGRVIFSVAHSDVTGGAEVPSLGLREYEVSVQQSIVAAGVVSEAGHEVEIFDCHALPQRQYLSAKPQRINETGPWTLAVEIHHNSNNDPSVNYAVVGHWAHSRWGDKAAACIAEELKKVVPWRVKGARPNTWFNPDNIVWFVGPAVHFTAVLIEAGFFSCSTPHGDLPSSEEYYGSQKNIDAEGTAIGQGIVRYIGQREGN